MKLTKDEKETLRKALRLEADYWATRGGRVYAGHAYHGNDIDKLDSHQRESVRIAQQEHDKAWDLLKKLK